DAALDDVLELDDAEHTGAIGDDQRGTSLARNALHGVLDRWWKLFSERREVLDDRIRSTLADLALADVDTAHPRMRRERHEARAERAQVALTQIEALLREYDDTAPFRGLIGKRSQLSNIGQFLLRHAGRRQKHSSLSIAERNGARLIEEQHIDVAGCLDGATGGRDDVRLHHPTHAGYTDRRQEGTYRRGNEADQQRDECSHRDRGSHLADLNGKQRER